MYRVGTTIFLTTHYIEEAERLCERIAFIVNGRIVRNERVSSLLQPIQERKGLLITADGNISGLTGNLAQAFPEYTFRPVSNQQLRVDSAQTIGIGPVVRFIEEQGAEVTEARQIKPTLEDVFVDVTGIESDAMRTEKNGGKP